MFYGRVVRPGEPLWLPDDTEKALAYEAAIRQACPRCATRPEDWVDDDGKPYDPPLLEAVTRHCEGCAQKARLELDIESDVKRRGTKPETARRANAGVFVAIDPYKGG